MKAPVIDPSWPEDVKALYHHDIQEIWDNRIARHVWNMYHSQLDMYCSLLDEDCSLKILDVGCAQGTLALLLAEKGHRVWAIDIRQQFLDYAASRHEKGEIHFLCGNVMKMEMEMEFDVIFANQIIEHLIYPREFTKRLLKWLRPGGRLVMTTPNGEYIKNHLPSFSALGDASKYAQRQFSADGDGHFFAYTAEELRSIFQQSGLTRVKVRHFETPWISGHMKVRYLHAFAPVGILKLLDRLTIRMPVLNKLLSHQIMIEGVAAP